MGNEFTKACNCGAQITMRKTDLGWKALNADGTPHRCDAPRTPYVKKEQQYAPRKAEPSNVIVGQMQRYNDAGVVLLTEGGILVPIAITAAKAGGFRAVGYSETEPGLWLECELGPNGFLMLNKEVPKPAWGDAAIEALKGNGGKSVESAEHKCKCAQGSFTPKDRLIVEQTMLKAYTDLFIATMKKGTTFEEARMEILVAVKEDIAKIIEL
jgi:hypothetical protein